MLPQLVGKSPSWQRQGEQRANVSHLSVQLYPVIVW